MTGYGGGPDPLLVEAAQRQAAQTAAVAAFFDDCYRRFDRYWWRERERYSADPQDHRDSTLTAAFLTELAVHSPGRALDLGAGEGSDAIRLALLGYEVVAVEASEVGAEKIVDFARDARATVEVIHGDATQVRLTGVFDVIICNGLLHYVHDATALLARMAQVTSPGGIHLVSAFTDATPVPDCHRVIDVLCDAEDGATAAHYGSWERPRVWLERGKPETSHPGFPPHVHSFIKVLAKKPSD